MLSFATIVELATLVSFIVVMAGGKFKREDGWKLVGGLLLVDAAIEFVGMGLVVSDLWVNMVKRFTDAMIVGLPFQQ